MSETATTGELAHGGRLSEARRLFPDAPGPWLDLSTGVNPLAYPMPALGADCFARLPDADAEAALRVVAARAYGVADPACVAAAPGTQILINLLPRLMRAARVAVLGPTYAEHAQAWQRGGATVTAAETFAALDLADVAVLCNPNNPDGRRHAPERLIPLANLLAARGGFLVVDEAFADLAGQGVSVAGALPHPGLIVLRSFGKTYGLAGLRLGFALASPIRAAAIRSALGPWAVSGPALAAGTVALADREWLAETASRLEWETLDLDACIVQTGLRVVGGTDLFRLAEGVTAQRVFATLGGAGIFVRRFADRPHWLRFGFPGRPQDWDRLREAVRIPPTLQRSRP